MEESTLQGTELSTSKLINSSSPNPFKNGEVAAIAVEIKTRELPKLMNYTR